MKKFVAGVVLIGTLMGLSTAGSADDGGSKGGRGRGGDRTTSTTVAGSSSTTAAGTVGSGRSGEKRSDSGKEHARDGVAKCNRLPTHLEHLKRHLARIEAAQVKLELALVAATTAGDTELVAKIERKLAKLAGYHTRVTAAIAAAQAALEACATTTTTSTTSTTIG